MNGYRKTKPATELTYPIPGPAEAIAKMANVLMGDLLVLASGLTS